MQLDDDLERTGGPKEPSAKGPRTRAAIIEAAGIEFSTSGYEATTLEQIGARLALTRSTVLFHFATKRALLLAVVQPLFDRLESLLPEYEKHPVPLAPRLRRRMLTQYCDAVVEHRYATILVVRDLTTLVHIDLPATGPGLVLRMFALLQGHDPDRDLKLRTAAALGSILRPVCQPPIDPRELDSEARKVIVGCALAAYGAKMAP